MNNSDLRKLGKTSSDSEEDDGSNFNLERHDGQVSRQFSGHANGVKTPGFSHDKKFSFGENKAESHEGGDMLMMIDNFEAGSEKDDDVSSMGSDFVQPRFGGKNRNRISGMTDLESDYSSEMEAFSEDEEVNEIMRRHSLI